MRSLNGVEKLNFITDSSHDELKGKLKRYLGKDWTERKTPKQDKKKDTLQNPHVGASVFTYKQFPDWEIHLSLTIIRKRYIAVLYLDKKEKHSLEDFLNNLSTE